MNVVTGFFYLFSIVMLLSAFMVITARNPVHAVLYLILCFFNAAGLFLLLGAEFLAMILVVVYVGAVAVLFLFVVMMLDVDFVAMRQGLQKNLAFAGLMATAFAIELALVMGSWVISPEALAMRKPAALIPIEAMNTRALGRVLYTEFAYFFQLAGLILLVAMIGAIVLTLRDRKFAKRQDIMRQNARTPETAIEIRQVTPGQGI